MSVQNICMAIADEKEYRDKIFKCPFCLAELDKMETITTPFGNDVEGGRCTCGAAYVQDLLGKNLGDVFNDALAMAFDWDYDTAFEGDENTYEEAIVRLNRPLGKYLLGDGGRLDRSTKYVFIRRIRKN